jgi:hypothetical protein
LISILVVYKDQKKFFELSHLDTFFPNHVPQEINQSALPKLSFCSFPPLFVIPFHFHQLHDVIHAINLGNDTQTSEERDAVLQR